MPAREMSRTENLSPAALVARLKEPAPPVLIDVREEWEWTLGHLPDALHVPMGQLPKRLNELPRDRDLVLYCHHGSRSYRAMEFLRQMGFDHVAHLDGGVAAWVDEVSADIGRY
jgi:adenylyltransferase/sulfurtransferase